MRDFYDEAIRKGEELEHFKFFTNEEYSYFTRTQPADAIIIKYQEKYVIFVEPDRSIIFDEYELPEEFQDESVFDSYEDAEKRCKEFQTKGIRPGTEIIADCVNATSHPKDISIVAKWGKGGIEFNAYYKGGLLIEHLKKLNSKDIDKAIPLYDEFEQTYGIKFVRLGKEQKIKRSRQRYYHLDFFDEKSENCSRYDYRFPIPKATRSQQRCLFKLIDRADFAAFLEEKRSHT